MTSIYPRRLPSRTIRVLVVHPGSIPDPIHLHLQEVSIDDPPPFEALSYVWGDPTQCSDVYCSEQTVSVTKSLHDALENFRLQDRELMIWADALCINQNDMKERSEQVQLMREIYTRATTVVVWLGLDEDGEAERAIPLMESIHQACADQALSKGVELLSMTDFTLEKESKMGGLAGVSIADVQAVAKHAGQTKPDQEAWAALGWLLSRPWFTRVWCVQEIVLARSSRIYVGSHSFDWEKLGITAAWLGEHNLRNDYDVPPELDGLNWENAYGMFDTGFVSGSSLLDVLLTFRDFNATNPRDKVYGLLGLVNEQALEKFSGVDYRKTVPEVYADVVKTSVSSSGTLAALCYAKHGIDYERNEFPSWVPRWDTSEDVCSILHSFSETAWEEGDKHGLPGSQNFNPSSDGTVALYGVRFDTVSWISERLDVEHFKEDITSVAAAKHPFLDIWHRASSNKCYALFPSVEHSFTAILEMAHTLTAGFNDGYEIVVQLDSNEERQEFYADFLTYIRHLFDVAAKTPETFDPLEVALCEGDASRFRIAASRSCDQRRVFETADGFYGLGPACAREGDVVILLYGSPTPFVVRQVEDGWILLGDGFVGPLMPESADDNIRKRFGKEELFVLV